jgi:hypothetical protein
METERPIHLQASTFSVIDIMPISGTLRRELASPAPVIDAALNPRRSTRRALYPSKTPGDTTIFPDDRSERISWIFGLLIRVFSVNAAPTHN